MSGYPWDKGYKPRPLDPRLYSDAQCRAAAGTLSAADWEWFRLFELAHRYVDRTFPSDRPEGHPIWQTPDMVTMVAKVQARKGGHSDLPEPSPESPDSSADTRTGPTWPGMCGRCARRWTSLVEAHCPSCHRHFSTAAGFDMHRREGACVDPVTLSGRRSMHVVDRVDGAVWVRAYGATR